ncbi:hypothetical protein AB6A40_005932 [Gnathostoma spinigerum]|uniref:Uncharacterized protein n=1 Tax=Gnathostoma spinigerum TaxID=75299 RepID=A0ABD6EGV9_9BILA
MSEHDKTGKDFVTHLYRSFAPSNDSYTLSHLRLAVLRITGGVASGLWNAHSQPPIFPIVSSRIRDLLDYF